MSSSLAPLLVAGITWLARSSEEFMRSVVALSLPDGDSPPGAQARAHRRLRVGAGDVVLVGVVFNLLL